MILRPYQEDAVEFLVSHRRAFIQAPAGSGKTIIGSAALSQATGPLDKIYWLANTTEQVDQAKLALEAAGVNATVKCVASGIDLSDADAVVMDECHHYGAETWLEILQPAIERGALIWGLSATPFGEDEERNETIQQTFLDFGIITREEVMAGGHLVQGVVKFLDLDKPNQYDKDLEEELGLEVDRLCKRFPWLPDCTHPNAQVRAKLVRETHSKRAKWRLTLNHLQENASRNAAIVGTATTAMADGETVIVLVASIQHGKKLASLIPGSAMLHSKLPKKLRRQLVEGLRSGKLKCAVATSLMDEGADFPIASTLVLAVGGRSATKTIQRTGRVMRPHEDKEHGVIIDFVDRGLGFAYSQHRARKRTYQQLGYIVK